MKCMAVAASVALLFAAITQAQEAPSPAKKAATPEALKADIEALRPAKHIFLRGEDGSRPVFGTNETFQTNPHWRDYLLFYEYFHGDTGRGVGASHQTGWTALVAKLLEQTEGR